MSRKIHHDLHVPFEKLSSISVADLLAIEGPKFITHTSHRAGQQTLAVLISHEKWKTMNHQLPEVDPVKAELFFVDEQAYMVIPAINLGGTVYQAKPETGLKIITERKSRKRLAK